MTEFAKILRRMGSGAIALSHGGELVLPAEGLPPLAVPADVVRTLRAEGLIVVSEGVARRTAEARPYLRRALATAADPAHAAQHRVMEERADPAGGATRVMVNAAESPLAWLASRRDRSGQPFLSPIQVEAGQRLAADHEKGMRRERITQGWDVSGVRGDAPRDRLSVSEAASDARRRVERALDAVGEGLATILVAVCCEERGLEDVEKRNGWPQRSGKVVLRLALDRLAAHYGLAEATPRRVRAPLVQWGASDYRPSA